MGVAAPRRSACRLVAKKQSRTKQGKVKASEMRFSAKSIKFFYGLSFIFNGGTRRRKISSYFLPFLQWLLVHTFHCYPCIARRSGRKTTLFSNTQNGGVKSVNGKKSSQFLSGRALFTGLASLQNCRFWFKNLTYTPPQ
jgi:hypothetical protein